MIAWEPLPESITWPLAEPVKYKGVMYGEITVRAPTGAEVLKATAMGGSNLDSTCRLIEAVSGVPFDVVKDLPYWRIRQMGDYMDQFTEAPAPDPLEQWRERRQAAIQADMAARAEQMALEEEARRARQPNGEAPTEPVPTEVTILC